MSKEILTFSDIEIEKHKFYHFKSPINCCHKFTYLLM